MSFAKSVVLPVALAVAAGLFSGCSPFIKVYSEEEPGINLYKYTTYRWLNMPTVTQGNSGPERLSKNSEKVIRTAVEDHMRRYGFSPCDGTPDLMLHYHVVIKNEVFYLRDTWCDEESWNQYGRCNRIRPVNYAEGTLILDFIDAKTGNQVWRGAVTGAVESLRPEEADARIREAVRLMFKKFPQQAIPGRAEVGGSRDWDGK
jgi:Domain of unknown function (DUF4136)